MLGFAGLRIASVSFFDESLGMLATKHPVEQLAQRVKVENIDSQEPLSSLMDQGVRGGFHPRGSVPRSSGTFDLLMHYSVSSAYSASRALSHSSTRFHGTTSKALRFCPSLPP